MFLDFATLWKHRERPQELKRWVIVWVKRFLNLISVMRLLIAPVRLRSKGALVGRLVVLGKARIEGDYANLMIGNETSLGRCHIALHDSVTIGNRVVLNDGVEILTASHSLSDPQWQHKKAPIVIGDYAWIATHAILLPGVTIGRGAVVGAGAVVRNDVPDYAVVIGNPAQITDSRRSTLLSYSPVLLNAPFEAWVGRNISNMNRQAINS
jgi:acetyltransferase-like isoleucine patch superfamily enzyme